MAYIPKGKVVGLFKIPRIVDIFARRLQVQERMTRQIVDLIRDLIDPLGVAVVVEGLHLCMMMRGVQKHNARMTTSAMQGAFRSSLAPAKSFENIRRGLHPPVINITAIAILPQHISQSKSALLSYRRRF